MLLENAQNAKKKVSQKKGLANLLQIGCSTSDCDFVYSTYNSKTINHQSTPGQNPFDVNSRAFIDFREIGKGSYCHGAIIWLNEFLTSYG